MAKDHGGQTPLTERDTVPCLFVTDIEIDASEGTVRLVASVKLPYFGGEMIERRIVGRWTVSDGYARDFGLKLRKALGRGGH